jgi:hypothetical protein
VRRIAVVIAITLAVAACDSGPSGPGSILARATGPDVGGALLEIRGTGIRGFAGRGSTRVYSAAVPDRPGVFRVVLVDPEGGDMGFDIQVDDRGMEGPAATVISVAGTDNGLLPVADLMVRFER